MEMKNYNSDSSQSDMEAPPGFLNREYDPVGFEARKQVRNSGREFNFKEKNFKSGIYLRKIKPPTPEPPKIIEEPVEVKAAEPQVDPEWRRLSLIILI